MPTIKNRAVLDSRPFAQGIDQMQGKVRGFDKQLKMIKGSMGAIFAVGGIAAFVKSTLNVADEIDNMAKQSGLGVEALQALRAAGKEAGVSFETMRPPINALRRAMDKAKEGSEQQVEAFKAMGISMGDLKKMKVEEVLAKVGKAMNTSGDNSEALVASTVLLGAESTRLQGIFKDLGEVGIDGLIQKYKDLGQVIDEQTIKTLDRQEEAMKRLGERAKTVGVNSLGTFMMGLEGIGAVAGSLAEGQSFAEAWESHINSLNESASNLNDTLEETTELTEQITGNGMSDDAYKFYAFMAEEAEKAMNPLDKLVMLQDRLREQVMTEAFYVKPDDYKRRLKLAKEIKKTEDEIAKINEDQSKLMQEIFNKGGEIYESAKSFGQAIIEGFTGSKASAMPETQYSSLRRIGGNLAGGMPKSESRQEKLIRQNEEQLRLQRQATQALISIEQQRGAVL